MDLATTLNGFGDWNGNPITQTNMYAKMRFMTFLRSHKDIKAMIKNKNK
jgi:hypothetical protein